MVRLDRADLRLDTETGRTLLLDHETGRVVRYSSGKTDYPVRFLDLMRNFIGTIQGQEQNYLTPEDLWLNNWSGVELTTKGECTYNPNLGTH
jgi:hypothetical protein